MIKIALLATATVVGLTGAAVAADVAPRRPIGVAPIIPVPALTWSGFYAGFNAGAAWRDNQQ